MPARLHELENARLARLNAVNTEAIDLARRGVESQREIIYSVRALLQIVSRLYARIPLDTPDCNQYIADLSAGIPWIHGLSIASADCRIECSTEPLSIGLDLSDRPQHVAGIRAQRLSDRPARPRAGLGRNFPDHQR
jgi:hypothetical protein